jgi:hypothetical protein
MTILGTATTATTAETEGAFQGKFKATVALTAPLTDGQSIAAKVVKAGFVVANTLAAVAAAASLSQLRVWRLDNPDNANPVTVRVAMADFDPAVTDYYLPLTQSGALSRFASGRAGVAAFKNGDFTQSVSEGQLYDANFVVDLGGFLITDAITIKFFDAPEGVYDRFNDTPIRVIELPAQTGPESQAAPFLADTLPL